MARVYAEVARRDTVGARDSFFDIGGTSLGATRVAARVQAALGVEVGVRDVFDHPTVEGLAALLDGRDAAVHRPELAPRPRPEFVPLSPAQARMWFIKPLRPVVARLQPAAAHPSPGNPRHRGAACRHRRRGGAPRVAAHDLPRLARRTAPGGAPRRRGRGRDVPGEDGPPRARRGRDPARRDRRVRRHHRLPGADGADAVVGDTAPEDTEWVLMLVVHHISADGASLAPLSGTSWSPTSRVARVWRPRNGRCRCSTRTSRCGSTTCWDPRTTRTPWPLHRSPSGDARSRASRRASTCRPTIRGPPCPLCGGDAVRFSIEPGLRRRLVTVARENDVSQFMLMHTALAVLLERLSGSTDIAIGTPVAGRGEEALDEVVGMFVNTVVLRTDVDPDLTVADLLATVRAGDVDAMAHADVPFERLVEVLDVPRSTAHHPLFQVALSFDNNEAPELHLPGLRVEVVDPEFEVAKFDLQVTVGDTAPEGEAAPALISYATDLFDQATVRGFADRFLRVLDAIASDTSARVGSIDILGPAERADLVAVTGPAAVTPEPLSDLLRRGVAVSPHGPALVFGDTTLTYSELDNLADGIARALIGRGVGPGTVVALGMRRSLSSILGTWSIARTGAAYLPINPEYPDGRISGMLADSRALVGLTTADDRGDLPDDVEWIDLDDLVGPSAPTSQPAPCRRRSPTPIAPGRCRSRTPRTDLHVGLDGCAEGRRRDPRRSGEPRRRRRRALRDATRLAGAARRATQLRHLGRGTARRVRRRRRARRRAAGRLRR